MALSYQDPEKYLALREQLLELVSLTQNIQDLHKLKAQLIGENGFISNEVKTLGKEELGIKKLFGPILNRVKADLTNSIKEKEEFLAKKDLPIPDLGLLFEETIGEKHIITESIEQLHRILSNIGFEFFEGPDIEKTYYNFDALNMPESHSARDNNDTFYMDKNKEELLRTQVTAVQIRLLESIAKMNKEVRAYSIGNVFRNDAHDATHSCQFQQIEGVILEKGVTMQHLKGFIEYLLESFFERKVKVTFKPSYFPFTEPSCEVYAYTEIINGKLVLSEKGSPLEIGGCGIIHPSILKKFNKEGCQAFAFGMGLERWIMLKYGVKNIHSLYNNKIHELKYIKQNKTC